MSSLFSHERLEWKGRLLVLTRSNGSLHAGAKAPHDIRTICRNLGFTSLDLPLVPDSRATTQNIWRYLKGLRLILMELFRARRSDFALIQYPLVGRFESAAIPWIYRRSKTAILIHDLDFLRIAGFSSEKDKTFLEKGNVLIVHNTSMAKKISEIIPNAKVINLEIFDYILGEADEIPAHGSTPICLYVFGNLAPMKAAYLYDDLLCAAPILAYGPNCEEDRLADSVQWCGVLNMHKPQLGQVNGYGLVWDGVASDRLSGDWGEYLKVNTPHKLSFYIALGIPVVVPAQAAMAPFVKRSGIGFVVDSIAEAGRVIAAADATTWNRHIEAVLELRQRLSSGFHTRKAVSQALERVSQTD